MTRITITTDREDIHIPVTLELIAAMIAGTSDAGLKAGQTVTFNLTTAGLMTDHDGQLSHSQFKKRPGKPAQTAQLKLAM